MRGELSDEEDKEKYCVDFFQKSLDQTGTPQLQGHDSSAIVPPNNEDNGESDASSLFETKFVGPGSTTGTVDNNEHKRFVR